MVYPNPQYSFTLHLLIILVSVAIDILREYWLAAGASGMTTCRPSGCQPLGCGPKVGHDREFGGQL